MFNLLPKDENFFEDLDALASSVRISAGHLNELIKRFPHIDKELIAIELQRQSARQRMQAAIVRLDNDFITPLDREDILNLIGQLRVVVDRVADLSQRFRLYRLPNLYPNLSSQSANLLSLATEVQAIIARLRSDTSLKSATERLDMGILETARHTGRKYGLNLCLLYQSLGQLTQTWGQQGRQAWFDSAYLRIFSHIQDYGAADFISKACGEFTAVGDSVTEGMGSSAGWDRSTSTSHHSTSQQQVARRLINPKRSSRVCATTKKLF
jgi:hypothetical protein